MWVNCKMLMLIVRRPFWAYVLSNNGERKTHGLPLSSVFVTPHVNLRTISDLRYGGDSSSALAYFSPSAHVDVMG